MPSVDDEADDTSPHCAPSSHHFSQPSPQRVRANTPQGRPPVVPYANGEKPRSILKTSSTLSPSKRHVSFNKNADEDDGDFSEPTLSFSNAPIPQESPSQPRARMERQSALEKHTKHASRKEDVKDEPRPVERLSRQREASASPDNSPVISRARDVLQPDITDEDDMADKLVCHEDLPIGEEGNGKISFLRVVTPTDDMAFSDVSVSPPSTDAKMGHRPFPQHRPTDFLLTATTPMAVLARIEKEDTTKMAVVERKELFPDEDLEEGEEEEEEEDEGVALHVPPVTAEEQRRRSLSRENSPSSRYVGESPLLVRHSDVVPSQRQEKRQNESKEEFEESPPRLVAEMSKRITPIVKPLPSVLPGKAMLEVVQSFEGGVDPKDFTMDEDDSSLHETDSGNSNHTTNNKKSNPSRNNAEPVAGDRLVIQFPLNLYPQPVIQSKQERTNLMWPKEDTQEMPHTEKKSERSKSPQVIDPSTDALWTIEPVVRSHATVNRCERSPSISQSPRTVQQRPKSVSPTRQSTQQQPKPVQRKEPKPVHPKPVLVQYVRNLSAQWEETLREEKRPQGVAADLPSERVRQLFPGTFFGQLQPLAVAGRQCITCGSAVKESPPRIPILRTEIVPPKRSTKSGVSCNASNPRGTADAEVEEGRVGTPEFEEIESCNSSSSPLGKPRGSSSREEGSAHKRKHKKTHNDSTHNYNTRSPSEQKKKKKKKKRSDDEKSYMETRTHSDKKHHSEKKSHKDKKRRHEGRVALRNEDMIWLPHDTHREHHHHHHHHRPRTHSGSSGKKSKKNMENNNHHHTNSHEERSTRNGHTPHSARRPEERTVHEDDAAQRARRLDTLRRVFSQLNSFQSQPSHHPPPPPPPTPPPLPLSPLATVEGLIHTPQRQRSPGEEVDGCGAETSRYPQSEPLAALRRTLFAPVRTPSPSQKAKEMLRECRITDVRAMRSFALGVADIAHALRQSDLLKMT